MPLDTQYTHIVDDDAEVRASLQWLFESVKIPVRTYESGISFLDQVVGSSLAGCVILDVRMPRMSGLEVLRRLRSVQVSCPIIYLTAHGDIQMAVEALKMGAYDFIEKPYNNQRLLDCVFSAFEFELRTRGQSNADTEISARLKMLSAREREILDLILEGKSNKEIGRVLEISFKTVEAHRGRMLAKMSVSGTLELVRAMTTFNILNAGSD